VTKQELARANYHPWESKNYCPPALRDLRKVLADATPQRVEMYGWSAEANKNVPTGEVVYRWWMAGGDWWGVCPPDGVVPEELIRKMHEQCGTRDFPTAKDAVIALRRAAAALDNRIPPG
jgi:hypothetical protein